MAVSPSDVTTKSGDVTTKFSDVIFRPSRPRLDILCPGPAIPYMASQVPRMPMRPACGVGDGNSGGANSSVLPACLRMLTRSWLVFGLRNSCDLLRRVPFDRRWKLVRRCRCRRPNGHPRFGWVSWVDSSLYLHMMHSGAWEGSVVWPGDPLTIATQVLAMSHQRYFTVFWSIRRGHNKVY